MDLTNEVIVLEDENNNICSINRPNNTECDDLIDLTIIDTNCGVIEIESDDEDDEIDSDNEIECIFVSSSEINSQQTELDSQRTELDSQQTEINSQRTELDSQQTEIDSQQTEINSPHTEIEANSCSSTLIEAELISPRSTKELLKIIESNELDLNEVDVNLTTSESSEDESADDECIGKSTDNEFKGKSADDECKVKSTEDESDDNECKDELDDDEREDKPTEDESDDESDANQTSESDDVECKVKLTDDECKVKSTDECKVKLTDDEREDKLTKDQSADESDANQTSESDDDECKVKAADDDCKDKSADDECLNSPNDFCLMCGKSVKSSSSSEINKEIRVELEEYFESDVQMNETFYQPNVLCPECKLELNLYQTGDLPKKIYEFPVVWKRPNQHPTDCYFCNFKPSTTERTKFIEVPASSVTAPIRIVHNYRIIRKDPLSRKRNLRPKDSFTYNEYMDSLERAAKRLRRSR